MSEPHNVKILIELDVYESDDQNEASERAFGDILWIIDRHSELDGNGIRKLRRYFHDSMPMVVSRIGVVKDE
ncbi:MAG: hypothetical protein P4L67_04450 [Candidatus Pacebacteria bacterium]|nr:hypothetical protein [Candidatus Paceibacterota bacterium]